MQTPIRAFEHGRGEYFAHRNIDIRHAIFEIRLPCRMFQGMQRDSQIRLVPALTSNADSHSPIQHIDKFLLHILI